MSEMILTHSDCRNYCNVDVAKGKCRRTNEMTVLDATSCENYQQLPKCKFCSHYAATEEQLGICNAEADHPWAYAEMIAVTCEMFVPA